MSLNLESELSCTAPPVRSGSSFDLWVGAQEVITVSVDRDSQGWPPNSKHCENLNRMIQEMARAVQAVIYFAENESSGDANFTLQPIAGLTAGIILLSQLSEGVRSELGRSDVDKESCS